MVKFLSVDKVMSGSASGIDAMEVFPAIQENKLAMAAQIVGGNEFATPMVLEGNPSEASSSMAVSQRNVPRLDGDFTLPDSIKVDVCVEFLERFLEHHVFESPSHDKIWTKKILQKIAKEVKVLPNGNRSIIENSDEDIMSNWKSYVEELIQELKVVQSGGLHAHNSGLYVLTNTPYGLILEMVAEMVVD